MLIKYFYLFIYFYLSSCADDNLQMKNISGESFIFKNEECRKFIIDDKDIFIKSVYSYTDNKIKQFYVEGKDYTFDDETNSICRLKSSGIKNFDSYSVIYRSNSEKFAFMPEPRNPPRTIPYYAYVDYKYKEKPILVKSSRFLDYKLNQKDLKILMIGDSIFASADTNAQYYDNDKLSDNFMTLVSKNYENLYTKNLEVNNLSQGGESLGYVSLNFKKIIDYSPDIIILSFGMNDHVLGNIQGQQDYFYSNYSLIIKQLKSRGFNKIILFGFPQQNMRWEQEDSKQTIIYNQLIQKIATENDIVFIDIYSVFNKIKNKNLNEELYGDYMHHPNSFGHKIYFSALMPYFLKSDVYDTEIIDYINIK